MKRFLRVYLVTLLVLFMFLFFGGSMLFDFRERFWVAAAACGFVIAAVLSLFLSMWEKIDALEAKVQALEEGKTPPDA